MVREDSTDVSPSPPVSAPSQIFHIRELDVLVSRHACPRGNWAEGRDPPGTWTHTMAQCPVPPPQTATTDYGTDGATAAGAEHRNACGHRDAGTAPTEAEPFSHCRDLAVGCLADRDGTVHAPRRFRRLRGSRWRGQRRKRRRRGWRRGQRRKGRLGRWRVHAVEVVVRVQRAAVLQGCFFATVERTGSCLVLFVPPHKVGTAATRSSQWQFTMACVLACTSEFAAKTNSLLSAVSPWQDLSDSGGSRGGAGGGGGDGEREGGDGGGGGVDRDIGTAVDTGGGREGGGLGAAHTAVAPAAAQRSFLLLWSRHCSNLGVLLARSDTGMLANTEHFSAWKKELYIPGADDPSARKSRDLGGFMVPLAALCPVDGQDGTLPRCWAMASLAPPSPHAKKSESMAPHFLRRGPPSSDGRIRPAGASQKGMRTTNRI